MSVTIDQVKRIISLQLGIREIGDHDRFIEDLRVESVDMMNIVIAVEEKFHIHIEESEIHDIQTPAVLLALIQTRVA